MRFKMVGYESSNFLFNADTLFWCFLYWILMAVLYLYLKVLSSVFGLFRLRKVLEVFSIFIFYNFIIRVLLESYLDFSIASLLNIKALNYQSLGDTIASYSAFIALGALCVFTLFIFFYTIRNAERIKLGFRVKSIFRFKAFHDGLKKESNL